MRFFRFNLDTNTEYDALRLYVDAILGYSSPSTCINPYASAPVDQKGRVVLNLVDATPGYDLLVAGADLLVAAGKAKSLTQDEYDASFFPGSGGGVSSWNDLTDKPASFPPSDHTQAATTVTVATTFSFIAPAFANVEEALGSIDSALASLQAQVSTASDYGVQGYVSILPNSGLTVVAGDLQVAFGTGFATACRGNDSRLSNSRTPTGAASGSLAGSYPNPTIATGAVATASLADGAVTIAKTTGIQKAITSGTAAPSGGSPGDIYLRYSP